MGLVELGDRLDAIAADFRNLGRPGCLLCEDGSRLLADDGDRLLVESDGRVLLGPGVYVIEVAGAVYVRERVA